MSKRASAKDLLEDHSVLERSFALGDKILRDHGAIVTTTDKGTIYEIAGFTNGAGFMNRWTNDYTGWRMHRLYPQLADQLGLAQNAKPDYYLSGLEHLLILGVAVELLGYDKQHTLLAVDLFIVDPNYADHSEAEANALFARCVTLAACPLFTSNEKQTLVPAPFTVAELEAHYKNGVPVTLLKEMHTV